MFFGSSVILFIIFAQTWSARLPLEVFQHRPTEHHLHHHRSNHNNAYLRKKISEITNFKVLYQIGNSNSDLPECRQGAICSKIDIYDTPWMERQCRCGWGRTCPNTLQFDDGFTLADKTRQYKLCEPVKRLPKCRYFRDTTWTLVIYPNNITEQIVHCHCPKNSVTYLIKRQAEHVANRQVEYQYSFACSPQSRIRCQRKEPCTLFTVRKRQEFIDEVNTNTLCQCPHAHRCPRHHKDYGVIAGKSYSEESIKTYSGYCLPVTL